MSGRTAVCLHSVEERLIRSVRFFRLEAAIYATPSLSVETPDAAVRISWPFYTERVGTASNRNRCRTERRFFLRFLLSFCVSFCWTGLIGVCVWEGLPRLSLFSRMHPKTRAGLAQS